MQNRLYARLLNIHKHDLWNAYNKCKRPSPPDNGAIACDNMLVGMFCTIHCNNGYAFFKNPPHVLSCGGNGKWSVDLNKDIPDCSEATESNAQLGGTAHYLAENCDEQDPDEVKKNFLKLMELLLNKYFPRYCSLSTCKLDNIYVKCGKKDDERRRRNTQNINRLEIDFQMKIPFPKNQSSNINKTVQNMQTSVFQSLNKSASTIEIRGVKLKLESPPTLRFVGLSCKDGFVLNGAICAACPPGYYYESSSKSCSICPVNQYQKKEAQMSCLACPSGTSTLNSKGSKTCKDDRLGRKLGKSLKSFMVD
ncbi:Sushi, von Willebrand factor type A, EGF and pentraxin domain-containing protein 1 [Exaiptasia diaphana]|nr:Sushi, von Willebrand factor type A, EGF and pentraxin domain-containing protein 1 [Exaiptasia diaphana]